MLHAHSSLQTSVAEWHVNCGLTFASASVMATRVNILKLMQEIHGFARITHRRPQPRPPALFLMEIRSQGYFSDLPKRKLNIAFQAQEFADLPHPVKINHLKDTSLSVVLAQVD